MQRGTHGLWEFVPLVERDHVGTDRLPQNDQGSSRGVAQALVLIDEPIEIDRQRPAIGNGREGLDRLETQRRSPLRRRVTSREPTT